MFVLSVMMTDDGTCSPPILTESGWGLVSSSFWEATIAVLLVLIESSSLSHRDDIKIFSKTAKGSTINDLGGRGKIENELFFSAGMPFENYFSLE